MDSTKLFPYLVRGPLPADTTAVAVSIGHGLFAQIFEDRDEGGKLVHGAVGAEQLRETGLTVEDVHRVALDNLAKFAESDPALSIQILGKPGDAVHFLLYSDHPRAAACLRLPDLYEEARERLQTDEVLALAPQWESLVVLPKRDREFRDRLIGKLREVEADAERPLSFDLFELTPSGLREFAE